ncbi:MAG: TonB-dependent receptor [Pseudomonadota bacterium]|jgi:hemoglobin/transferrin/lactoferrin receptor protein|nr:TonB-dependent receptor [Rhodocyclaceae bacterium]
MELVQKVLVTAIAVISLPGTVAAEQTLGTVSVTAKGYAAEDLETPFATSALDREQILRRNSQNVGEALRGEPGLAVASDGAQGQNPVIRGLKKESVVLLVDGMRMNSAQPQGSVASFMTLGLADRIEVVKGPASVLYGTGALGGALNVILPQARFAPGTAFDAAASYDSASGGLRGTGIANFSQGDHALMIGASLARIDDYRAPSGKVGLTGYDSDALIAQYRFRIDAAQQLRVSIQQQTDKDVWYPGSKKPHANFAVVGNTIVHSPEQERRLAEIGYSRKGSGEKPLNVDVRVYRQDVERTIQSWSDRLQRDIGKTRVTFGTDGVDARADWLAHQQHLLSFGVNVWRMEASPERYLASPTPTSPLVRNDPFSGARIDAIGFYLQDDMRFGPLNVLAGLRRDNVKGHADSMNNGSVTTGLDRSDSATSGSIGLIYEVAPLVRPFINLSRGFRAAEMRERYEASPRGDGYFYRGNPQLKPEIATQFELGLKGASPTFQYSASLYRNRISDYISGRPTGATEGGLPVKQTVNLGEVIIAGFEAGTRWQFAREQWLSLGYSRLRGENRDLAEPLFQMPADELNVGWEGKVGAGWTADATVRFVRRQDRVATVFARGTENTTPGFGTLDLGATWRYAKDQWLRITLRNLADKAYHEHLAEGVPGQEIEAPGRSLQLVWRGVF